MSIEVQLRRDTRTNCEAATPLDGEVWIDQTLKTARAGDGVTAGGHLLKKWGNSYVLAPAQIAADQNDYGPTDLAIAEIVVLDLAADHGMSGLAGGGANREITLFNGSAFRLTLTSEDAASSAANRFHFAADLVLRPYQAVRLSWNAALSRWLDVTGRGDIGVTTLPEAVFFTGEIRPGQITADQNDWTPGAAWDGNLASHVYVNSDASHNITGLAGGAKGRRAVVVNNGSNPLVLKNASASSSAANRFDMGADITLTANQAATFVYDSTASRWKLLSHTAGQAVADGAVTAVKMAASALGFGALVNGYLAWSVSANALTVTVLTLAGATPSASDPVYARVRSATAADGAPGVLAITASLSLTVSSGSSLGAVASTPFKLWCALFNDAGTARLALINAAINRAIYPVAGNGFDTATAEGGAGGADSANIWYATAAIASATPYATLGNATWSSGLGTPGTWNNGPSRVEAYGPGVRLPGEVVGRARTLGSSGGTGTTQVPYDNTKPQSSEGDEYMSQGLKRQNAANWLWVRAVAHLASSAAGSPTLTAFLLQDSGADAIATAAEVSPQNYITQLSVEEFLLCGAEGTTTFKLRAGASAAGTTTFNGQSGSAAFNGTFSSFIEVVEIQA